MQITLFENKNKPLQTYRGVFSFQDYAVRKHSWLKLLSSFTFLRVRYHSRMAAALKACCYKSSNLEVKSLELWQLYTIRTNNKPYTASLPIDNMYTSLPNRPIFLMWMPTSQCVQRANQVIQLNTTMLQIHLCKYILECIYISN